MTLLMSLRGNAIIYYGEELGLTQVDIPFEQLHDPEAIANWPLTLSRDGARTPMPWNDSACAGFGSTTRLPAGELVANAEYTDGEWSVVFSRPIAAPGEHQVALDQGAVSVALALWQGAGEQRDGLKHVSMGWVTVTGG